MKEKLVRIGRRHHLGSPIIIFTFTLLMNLTEFIIFDDNKSLGLQKDLKPKIQLRRPVYHEVTPTPKGRELHFDLFQAPVVYKNAVYLSKFVNNCKVCPPTTSLVCLHVAHPRRLVTS